mmetsp:Transcript_76633/g.135203  ORF Transcript_76633/g.135203 Transcript_76633/m.135203 type:complete len:418 (-) Transcript_76633:7-1260(-)|eukprot:CAMPEP_0197659052 /NCGR_PEP_ID=MMETSP1338-20131121/46010_1 /TAXON_ID=43686 ORGANISM="Pelagodinium beii, Strain RCC1491" /NCGR_SAMPLE_ID=MMETSP1338 /ASSEMBLY_ACC=CAM_ASM_000754 /LENGTH=417 /DNA_ID=CAMNT_0043235797 /DNA_START=55 /DNA_END=1308 /DNA_ORIENTATION=+
MPEQDLEDEDDPRREKPKGQLTLLREDFEGNEDYMDVRKRLQAKGVNKLSQREVDRFIRHMREWGSGKIAMAWRCYFDADGDGELTFKEFCSALASLKYKGDIPRLWADLLSENSDTAGTLKLEVIDPEHAAYLEAFGDWCDRKKGGPTECFRAMDDDGSGTVTRIEFSTGLKELGFFTDPAIPKQLSTEELMMENLYPLLDQYGSGCITAEQLLFLEKDKAKRSKIMRQLARIREQGIEAAPEPLRNDAQRLLFRMSMSATQLGGKHWKTVRSEVACGDDTSQISPNFSFSTSSLDSIKAGRVKKPGRVKPLALIKPATSPLPMVGTPAKLRPVSSTSIGKTSQTSFYGSKAALPGLSLSVLEQEPEDEDSLDYNGLLRLSSGKFSTYSGYSGKAYSTNLKERKFFQIPRAAAIRI